MRHSGWLARGRVIAALAGAGLLAGCFAPHNDVLLFGTDTKVALDISANPENAGVPNLTIGYKRREFVWMPLLANGKDSAILTGADASLNDGKYTGTGPGPQNAQGDEEDTYSVIAAIGANISGGASTEATGTVGIAQFIATGLAARRLAEENLVDVLSVQAPSKKQLDAAEKRADNAEAKVIELTEVRTKKFASAEMTSRLEGLKAKIDKLSDSAAIAMEAKPPVNDPNADTLIAARDPNNRRATDGAVAKTMLRTRLEVGSSDDAILNTWETAIDTASP